MKKSYCEIFLFFHEKHVATSISKSFLYNISVQLVSKEKLKSKMARQKKITVSLKHPDIMKVILSVMLIGFTELMF